eukprot:6860432-Pyramimonas_sp.AAC.1
MLHRRSCLSSGSAPKFGAQHPALALRAHQGVLHHRQLRHGRRRHRGHVAHLGGPVPDGQAALHGPSDVVRHPLEVLHLDGVEL